MSGIAEWKLGEEEPFGTHPLPMPSVLWEHDPGGFVMPVSYKLFGLQTKRDIEEEDETRDEGSRTLIFGGVPLYAEDFVQVSGHTSSWERARGDGMEGRGVGFVLTALYLS
jgi:hypothetical protein